MTQQHTAYLFLATNVGNRQASLLQALQYLRARMKIGPVSSYYETKPKGCQGQLKYLNLVCEVETELGPEELLDFTKRIEKRMGRLQCYRNEPRAIDIDILLYGDLVMTTPKLTLPYPLLYERAFALAPLSEIAPGIVHPGLGKPVEALLAELKEWGVTRKSLKPRLDHDVQEGRPDVGVGLSRVGVRNLHRNIQIATHGKPILFHATLDLFADLNPDQAGVHMSRFTDAVESLVQEMTLEPSADIETLAGRLSRQVVADQRAVRSEVRIRARSPMNKTAPVTGKPTQELFDLIGIASSTGKGTRRLVGVEAEGMTVCPCAQEMVRADARLKLLDEGFDEDQVERILKTIPIASHNQRGRGTLLVGSDMPVRAEHLVYMVEAAMSSETYAILKRPDEFFVVNKAHRNARFVEDVVREMLRLLADTYPDLPGDAFVLARQENLESIHKHNAFAERSGTMESIRRELSGETNGPPQHMSLEEWLKQ